MTENKSSWAYLGVLGLCQVTEAVLVSLQTDKFQTWQIVICWISVACVAITMALLYSQRLRTAGPIWSLVILDALLTVQSSFVSTPNLFGSTTLGLLILSVSMILATQISLIACPRPVHIESVVSRDDSLTPRAEAWTPIKEQENSVNAVSKTVIISVSA